MDVQGLWTVDVIMDMHIIFWGFDVSKIHTHTHIYVVFPIYYGTNDLSYILHILQMSIQHIIS